MSTYVVQLLAGLGSAAVLFLVASGLTLIFGALRIVNFAHGSLYMVGAFVSVSLADAIGFGNLEFWIVLLLAALAVTILGVAMEVSVLRLIYGQTLLTQLLVTFAFVLIIGGMVRAIYGSQPRVTETPPFLQGSVGIMDRQFPVYQFFLMGLAAAVAIALWLMLYRTGLGRTVRAAVSDPELLALSGVNVSRLFTGVFALGCFFAGLAGAAVAPLGSVSLGIDISVILKAFVIVVIGGLGSVGGALVGAILIGVADSFGILWFPETSLAIVFAVLVVVLVLRPQGLFGRAES
jgi:branched-chain amino acid transport system permease protein